MKIEKKIYSIWSSILFKFVSIRSSYVINKTFLSISYLTKRPFLSPQITSKKNPLSNTPCFSNENLKRIFQKDVFSKPWLVTGELEKSCWKLIFDQVLDPSIPIIPIKIRMNHPTERASIPIESLWAFFTKELSSFTPLRTSITIFVMVNEKVNVFKTRWRYHFLKASSLHFRRPRAHPMIYKMARYTRYTIFLDNYTL